MQTSNIANVGRYTSNSRYTCHKLTFALSLAYSSSQPAAEVLLERDFIKSNSKLNTVLPWEYQQWLT